MNAFFLRLAGWSKARRKGASLAEFIVILPLFFLLCLVIWQLVVAGMAVMDTQAALRDAVKLAASTGDAEKAKQQFKTSFAAEGKEYEIDFFEIRIEGDEVNARAKTRIPFIFMDDEEIFTYEGTSAAPVLSGFNMVAGISAGPIRTWVGVLGPPVREWNMTSGFGYRIHPIAFVPRLHAGIDLAGPVGTPIYASADGVVVKAGASRGYGNLIIIDHGNGLATYYAHMFGNQIYVKPGDRVFRGQHIAGIGSAGHSTGPHLHFEVSAGGVKVDPLRYVSR